MLWVLRLFHCSANFDLCVPALSSSGFYVCKYTHRNIHPRYFAVNFAYFLMPDFLTEHLWVTASGGSNKEKVVSVIPCRVCQILAKLNFLSSHTILFFIHFILIWLYSSSNVYTPSV